MIANIFYLIKPFISRRLQLVLRQLIVRIKRKKYSNIWPIDPDAAKTPDNWHGWPDGKKFAFILMHDVDTQVGHDNCLELMKLEIELGFRSTFFFVPERYKIDPDVFNTLRQNGFDIGVHGLKHDGKLFKNKKHFLSSASTISKYLNDWNTKGFSSPSMHHNLAWMYALNLNYAISSFDTDPFEPQPDAVGTVFPFKVHSKEHNHSYIELPYTMPQDFTLFILMNEQNIVIWKKKTQWIAQHGGMLLVNTHPDYMAFNKSKSEREKYPVEYYQEFLLYIKNEFKDSYLHLQPDTIAEIIKNSPLKENIF